MVFFRRCAHSHGPRSDRCETMGTRHASPTNATYHNRRRGLGLAVNRGASSSNGQWEHDGVIGRWRAPAGPLPSDPGGRDLL